jgi:transcriptional antiterminator RfaH
MHDEISEKNTGWFVIHTNPRQEDRAEMNLISGSIETLAPKVKKRRYNEFTGRPTSFAKPLFPRYIFARFNLDTLLHRIRYTRGVHSVISFGNGPTPIDEEVIKIIKSRMGEDGFVRMGDEMNVGDPVAINSGIMKSFTGIFEREMKDADRVIVLLNTLNFQARLEVSREMVSKSLQTA